MGNLGILFDPSYCTCPNGYLFIGRAGFGASLDGLVCSRHFLILH